MKTLSKILVPAVALMVIASPLAAEPVEAPDAWPLVSKCLQEKVGLTPKTDFWQTDKSNDESGGVMLRKGLVSKLRADGKLNAAVACLEAGKVAEPKK